MHPSGGRQPPRVGRLVDGKGSGVLLKGDRGVGAPPVGSTVLCIAFAWCVYVDACGTVTLSTHTHKHTTLK